MVICFDVGNTDIVMGVFDGEKLICSSRFRYVKGLSEKEYLPLLQENIKLFNLDCTRIKACVLCCVVSNTVASLSLALKSALGVPVLLFKNDENCRLSAKVGDIKEVGTDIVAACMSAVKKYPLPCIVIDMGTATTVTALDAQGNLCGVSIIPGVFTSMWALHTRTGLPIDEKLNAPSNAIGTTTSESLASGIVLGSAFCLDGMISAFEKELAAPCSVCATGGGAQFIVPHCERSVILDENLLLYGLYYYYKNSIINN